MKQEIKEKLIMLSLGVFVGLIIASGCYTFSNFINKDNARPTLETRQEIRNDRNRQNFNSDFNGRKQINKN